jgi:hypothetical protein
MVSQELMGVIRNPYTTPHGLPALAKKPLVAGVT